MVLSCGLLCRPGVTFLSLRPEDSSLTDTQALGKVACLSSRHRPLGRFLGPEVAGEISLSPIIRDLSWICAGEEKGIALSWCPALQFHLVQLDWIVGSSSLSEVSVSFRGFCLARMQHAFLGLKSLCRCHIGLLDTLGYSLDPVGKGALPSESTPTTHGP